MDEGGPTTKSQIVMNSTRFSQMEICFFFAVTYVLTVTAAVCGPLHASFPHGIPSVLRIER